MNRMARYVSAEVLLYTFYTLLVLTGFFAFFELLNEVDRIGKGNYQIADMLVYVALTIPAHAYTLLPVASLIGGILAISALTSHSELTVMRVSGVSLPRLAGWLAITGLFFAVLTLLLGEYIAPEASRAGSRHRIEATQRVMVGDFQSGIWIKDGKQIANIAAMLPDMTLQGIRIYEFAADQRLEQITQAQSARFNQDKKHWELSEGRRTLFPADKKNVQLSNHAKLTWNTDVNPDMLAVLMVKPQDMSMRALASYIEHLHDNNQDAARYELSLWTKIFIPIACISMMLIALPFALLQRRSGGVGKRIFIGILIGVSFDFLNRIMGHLGALYHLSAPLAASLPTLLLFCGAGFVLWRQSKN